METMNDFIESVCAQMDFRKEMERYEVFHIAGHAYYKTDEWFVPVLAGCECSYEACAECSSQCCPGYVSIESVMTAGKDVTA